MDPAADHPEDAEKALESPLQTTTHPQNECFRQPVEIPTLIFRSPLRFCSGLYFLAELREIGAMFPRIGLSALGFLTGWAITGAQPWPQPPFQPPPEAMPAPAMPSTADILHWQMLRQQSRGTMEIPQRR